MNLLNMCRPPGFVLCLSASAVKTFYVRRCRRAAPASPSPDVPGEIKAIILSRQPSHRGLRVKKKSVFLFFFFAFLSGTLRTVCTQQGPCEAEVLSSSKMDTVSQRVNRNGLKSITGSFSN